MITIPNVISLSRIILGIAFFLNSQFYILIIGAFSDVLDGFIARKFNMCSKIGEALDPIADKIFWGLVSYKLYLQNMLPLWFFITLLLRDFVFLIAFTYMLMNKINKFKATLSGKLTAFIVGSTLISSIYVSCSKCMFKMYVVCIFMMIINIYDYYKRLYKN